MEEEFQTILLDLGTYTSKYGFLSDEKPQHLRSFFGTSKVHKFGYTIGNDSFDAKWKVDSNEVKNIFTNGIPNNFHHYEKLIHSIYYGKLQVAPEEHPMLISEPILAPKSIREKITQLLFETFNIPALLFENSSLLNLASMGTSSKEGVIIDLGHDRCSVSPIDNGYPLPHAVCFSKLGSKHITNYYVPSFNDKIKKLNDIEKFSIASKLKEKFSFVSLDYTFHENCYQKNLTSLFDLYKPLFHIFPVELINEFNGYANHEYYKVKKYTLIDNNNVIIDIKNEQFDSTEILFQPKNILGNNYKPSKYHREEILGIHEMALLSISKCDKDIHQSLCNNIIICGGSSKIKWMTERIEKGMNSLISEYQKEKVEARKFPFGYNKYRYCSLSKKVNQIKVKKNKFGNEAIWMGMKVIAKLDPKFNRFITMDEYEESGPMVTSRRMGFC